MSSVLHVLNGDSTAYSFKDTGLDGDILIWREVLSQGPLIEDISSAEFWEKRSEWISKGFAETPENYRKKVIEPLGKLSNIYDEITLWFEFDLHCQVNLLGVMNYLKQKTDLSAPAVFLICPADFPGKEYFMGMGELTGEELEYLYDNIRQQLSAMDFAIAEEAWKVYVSGDATKLKDYLNKTDFWGSMHLLKPALEAQLSRLQTNEKGLSYIEQKLLDIYNNGAKTRQEIYLSFWKTEKIFGMGDLEINIYLQRLIQKGLISL